ncbi:MAG: hypothetical protein IJL64_04710, partial [Bacteroidales bacterium]|nr:hypothetical protein [Bacteroidales bacterium]
GERHGAGELIHADGRVEKGTWQHGVLQKRPAVAAAGNKTPAAQPAATAAEPAPAQPASAPAPAPTSATGWNQFIEGLGMEGYLIVGITFFALLMLLVLRRQASRRRRSTRFGDRLRR